MSKVLPRDLFKEANLLNCIGRLIKAIDNKEIKGLSYTTQNLELFDIQYDPINGSMYIANIFFFDSEGECVSFFQPLIPEGNYPLMCEYNEDAYYIFDEEGDVQIAKNLFVVED